MPAHQKKTGDKGSTKDGLIAEIIRVLGFNRNGISNKYYTMKDHPEQYKRYSSFSDAINDVHDDA